MINRLLIRTRAFQVAYAHYHRDGQTLAAVEQDFRTSLERTYDLYLYFLRLIPSLTELHKQLLEQRRGKYLASSRDLNPDLRLAENKLAQQLAECEPLELWYLSTPLSWEEQESLLRRLLRRIESSAIYEDYIASPHSFENDRDFWLEVFRSIISVDDELADYLEHTSIYWDDTRFCTEKIECENYPGHDMVDSLVSELRGSEQYSSRSLSSGAVEVVKDFVYKSLKRAEDGIAFEECLLPMFRDSDDEAYAFQLVRQLIVRREQYMSLILEHNKTEWEGDRLADIDVLLILLGIVELLHFPSIAVHVTINEYVELTKHYSTPKSSAFVNGVLDGVVRSLREQKKILK